MDPAGHHPEPFGEALSHSSQRAAQIISLVSAAAQVAAHRKAARDSQRAAANEQARRALQHEERAARTQARAGWAPAHDARWLAQADLLQAARTWSAAAPYADTPDAAAAMRKSEERLRALHPYAMDRYDRLRSEGTSPPDAMRQTAPLFAREPHARPGQPGTRMPIGAGLSGPDARASDTRLDEPVPGHDPYQDAEHRGQRIVSQLQADAQAHRGSELSPDELATVLEARTNLPAEVIARLARAGSEEDVAAGTERAHAAELDQAAGVTASRPAGERAEDLRAARRDTLIADTAGAHASSDRAAAQLAAESFPCTAADGIRAAVTGTLQQPPPARTTAVPNARPPSLSA